LSQMKGFSEHTGSLVDSEQVPVAAENAELSPHSIFTATKLSPFM
jgi:hypothetical protein